MKSIKSKSIAFLVHLIISVFVIAAFLLFLKLFWYQDIFFELENVWEGLKILIIVDAILGPLLTFIVYLPGKKSLKFDLSTIAVLQLLALIYGGHLIYHQRPAVLAFVGDRFEVLAASEPVVEGLPNSHFDGLSFNYPAITYALPATSDKERTDFIFNNVQYSKIAERHRPIRDHIEILAKSSLNIDQLTPKSPKSEKSLQEFISESQNKEYLLLPLQGTNGNAMVIAISVSDTNVLGYIRIDPWKEYQR
ncbi:hypothetical protein [Aliikangiella coralliicola]|uniref:Type IV pilin accessory protein n=1 Tax=Aliikangiella coralliicola TaxID=2592383 RepID=A0A545TZY9_9GAMM|nr:hypothetical protein [Aliikangiella coralliicola]TQV82774.1 hypothetical protein FLL46_23665 [Aliikangiella coralliicola]